jgi:hypothetical protein
MLSFSFIKIYATISFKAVIKRTIIIIIIIIIKNIFKRGD